MNDQYSQLVAYIQQQLQQGVPSDNVRHALTAANWDPATVDHAMSQLGAGQTAQTPVPAQPVTQLHHEPTHEPLSAMSDPHAEIAPADMQDPYAHSAPATLYDPAYAQPLYGQSQPQANDGQLPAYPLTNNHEQLVANQAAPKKYRIWRAVGETLSAIKSNFLNVLVSILISYGVAVGAYVALVLGFAGLIVGSGSFGLGAVIGGGGGLGLILAFVLTGFVVSALVTSLVVCLTAQSIYDGAEGHKTPLKQTVVRAFKGVIRVTLAAALTYLVIVGPILVAAVAGVALAVQSNSASSILFIIIGYVASLIWMILATFRFGLTPIVALFEPDLPLLNTLGRSKHLLQKGGQWFIFKGYLLLFLLVIIISAATGQKNIDQLSNTNNILANILLSLLSVIMVGALVMLYRNRRIVRQ